MNHEDHAPVFSESSSRDGSRGPEALQSKDEVPERSKRHTEPPDGGWGWIVVAAAFFVAATLVGVLISFGIVFSEPLTRMQVSSTTTAWIVNTYIFLWNMSSIMAAPLCEVFSWRRVSLTGYFLASLAYMLMCFATSPVHVFLLFSVIISLSGGVSSSVILLIVPAYFNKRRGTAIAIVMTGSTVGQIIVPLLLRALLDAFSFRGCVLIFGAILANCCAAAMVFHPVEWHQRDPLTANGSFDLNDKQSALVPKLCNETEKLKNIETSSGSRRSNFMVVLINIMKNTCKHIKNMKHFRISLAALSFACFIVGYANFIAQLPFAMEHAGLEPKLASWCISVSAIGNTVVRIIVCCISDKKWFNRNLCYLFGTLLCGLSSIAIVFVVDRIELVLVSMVLWGIGIAAGLSVFYALLQDISGRSLYASGVSISAFFLAMTGILIGPFSGLIRDASNFSWSLGTCGALQLCCPLLWLLMPLAIRRDKRVFAKVDP